MTADIKLEAHLERVTSDADERLDNMLAATVANIAARRAAGASDVELEDAQLAVYALTGWMTARAGLEAVADEIASSGDEIDCDVLLECVTDGLEIPKETT